MQSASAGPIPVPAMPVAGDRREPAFQVREVLYPTDLAP